MAFTRTAYTVAEWAQACGLGETTIREHIANGNLVASYPTKAKAIIPLEEGLRWLRTLPTEQPASA
jgi:predicted transcriptional regulator